MQKKVEERKTFWEILSYGYLVKVRDEENLKERFSLRFNLAKIFAVAFLLFLLFFVIAFSMSLWLFKASNESDKSDYDFTLVKLTEKVDSLEQLSLLHQNYLRNIQAIMSNNPTTEQATSEPSKNEETIIVAEDIDEIHPIDSQFRKNFEGNTQSNASKRAKIDITNVIFFPPINGLVLKKFKPAEKHFGIDIVAKKGETIKAISDGTVILASWTQDTGFVIALQHKNSMVSFYKHNSVLLKKLGDVISVGEPIAIIGNSGELTNGPHLHFELWHDGTPINPEDFIRF